MSVPNNTTNMRILHVMKIVGIAGAENYLLQILPGLKSKEIHVEFLCLTPVNLKGDEQAFVSQLEEKGIKVHLLHYKTIGLSTRKKIRAIIKSGNFDLVHSHMIHADFFLALTRLTGRNKFKIVSTKHGHDEGYMQRSGFDPNGKKSTKFHWVAKFSEKQIFRSYAISNGLRDLFIAHGICNSDRIDMIYHGFDLDHSNLKDDPNLRKSPNQITMVGRFTELKGHVEAVKAMKIVIEKIPDAHLSLVGSGHSENEIKQLVKELDLEEHISFEGYQPNGVAYMASSDVVLIPSKAEGFGIVVLEAYSVQKPVIVFDTPALNELVIDEKTGLIAKPFEPADLANKLEVLLADKAKSSKLGHEGYQLLKTKFNQSTMIDQTISFYKKCMA